MVMSNFNDWINEIVVGVVTAILGGITWLIRTVLTNQKQIDMLKEDLNSRDIQRGEDRQMWRELRDDVKEVKRDILKMYQTKD